MQGIIARLNKLEAALKVSKAVPLTIEIVLCMPGPQHAAWLEQCANLRWNPHDPATWVDELGVWVQTSQGHLEVKR